MQNDSNIIIGSPCWFGSYAPPINTFLSENKIEGKNIYLLVCDGNNLRNTWKNYEEALNNSGEKETRPFVGILFNIENIEYFAPLSSPKEKHLHISVKKRTCNFFLLEEKLKEYKMK